MEGRQINWPECVGTVIDRRTDNTFCPAHRLQAR
jgi:hypothetical protein